MDPNAPRKAPDPEAVKRLQTVQRRVISALVITTVLHMSAGLIIAADHVGDRLDAQLGLNLIAAAFNIGGIACTLVLNGRSAKSWLLALGIVPSIFGIWWVCF